MNVGPGLPLWKSGYIASETTFDVSIGERVLPAFYVDAQTRQGMSGSRIFAHFSGIWNAEDPYAGFGNQLTLRQSTLGRGMQFLGCYSGRIGPEAEGAAIGLCWREETLREVCLGGATGQHPHVNAGTAGD